MLLALALATAASAGEPAWYHPDEVAAQSAVFQAAAGELGPRYQALEDSLRRLSRPLEDLELATALAGDRLSRDTRAWAEQTRRTALAGHLQAQRHVDYVQDEYGRIFGAALQRALPTVSGGATARECASGGGVQAMMGRGAACEGVDLNPALARALDADPLLADEVARLNALPWPQVQVEPAPQPALALTGTGGWVQLAPLARALWPDRLERRTDDLDRELAPFEDALDAGDEAALASAREARARYEAALAADGEVLLALVAEALEKKARKGGADVGACVNPVALGGCPGQDRTEEIIGLIGQDRRLQRGLAELP